MGLTYKIEGVLVAHWVFMVGRTKPTVVAMKRQMQGCCICVTAAAQLCLGAGDDHEHILKVL